MNKFLKEFKDRGFFYQCTKEIELSNLLDKDKINGYIGFDCTAESLHVGSLLQIMCLRLLQKYGHKPIVLIGGGTTRIGDPSGKDKTRKILTEKEIDKNIKNIEKILKNYLNSENPKTKPIFVNNFSWLKNLNYISFLRDIGKHFTINKMLTFDSVKTRLEREQSLSYMEFNYMILQAYDFLELNKKKDCDLQIGGSDQWGNIVNGVELIKRFSNKESFGLTTPLITLASGAKMGKTESGAIWLDKNLLSSYDYWQFWRNTDDRDVIKFLKYFTELDIKYIEEVLSKEKNINKLKIKLANEATKILHGDSKSKKAEKTALETFKLGKASVNLPTTKIKKELIDNNLSLLDLLLKNNITSSKGEARRAIKNHAIKINDNLIIDEKKAISLNDFKNDVMKISFGKKKHYLFKII